MRRASRRRIEQGCVVGSVRTHAWYCGGRKRARIRRSHTELTVRSVAAKSGWIGKPVSGCSVWKHDADYTTIRSDNTLFLGPWRRRRCQHQINALATLGGRARLRPGAGKSVLCQRRRRLCQHGLQHQRQYRGAHARQSNLHGRHVRLDHRHRARICDHRSFGRQVSNTITSASVTSPCHAPAIAIINTQRIGVTQSSLDTLKRQLPVQLVLKLPRRRQASCVRSPVAFVN